MAKGRDTFETDDTISSERAAARSNINTLITEKAPITEKASASDVFSGVLTRKEKKTERMQILLTEANRKILEEYSQKTGNSKNDIINRLIATLGENTDL